MGNSGIIRNRKKIESSINNAQRFLKVQQEFVSFDQYIWGFVQNKPMVNHWARLEEIPAVTELSQKISKDLKDRGFKFLGSTTVYAYLQAAGLVNDHLISCFRHKEVQ